MDNKRRTNKSELRTSGALTDASTAAGAASGLLKSSKHAATTSAVKRTGSAASNASSVQRSSKSSAASAQQSGRDTRPHAVATASSTKTPSESATPRQAQRQLHQQGQHHQQPHHQQQLTAPSQGAHPDTGGAPSPPYSKELLYALAAVQRAAMATTTVLKSLDAYRVAYSSSSSANKQGAIGQYKHASNDNGNGTSFAKAEDDSPVTVADFAAQALLISALHAAFPDDDFLGEEDDGELKGTDESKKAMLEKVWQVVKNTKLEDSKLEKMLGRPQSESETLEAIALGAKHDEPLKKGKRCWVMDPVDGTSAFMQGGQYAVVLALLENGKEVLGVCACPNMRFSEVVGRTRKTAKRREVKEFDTISNYLKEMSMKKKEKDTTEKIEEPEGVLVAAVKNHGATVRPLGRGPLKNAMKLDRSNLPPPKIDPRINDKLKPKAVLPGLTFVDSEDSPKTRADLVRWLAGSSYDKAVQLYSSHVRYVAMALGDRSYVQVRWPRNNKPWAIWDHVGTPLIYAESGRGTVTDMNGNALDYRQGWKMVSNWGVITADAEIHGRVADVVQKKLAELKRSA
ncbi:hypothetical protein VTI28DRAFT_1504 [Corynascus sepedonium]